MTEINSLQKALVQEITTYLGWDRPRWRGELVRLALGLPARRFARLAVHFDQIVEAQGFPEAAHWLLPAFIPQPQYRGVEFIPARGPLLIAANHPGTVDTFLLAACLPRTDLKIIARQMPLLDLLPATRPHLILTTLEPADRMRTLRAALRHLQTGGALLVFPSGNLDPDPACMLGSWQAIETWSNSLELLLQKVPQTRFQVAITSGLVAPDVLRSRLPAAQKDPRRGQIVAEVIQALVQLSTPLKFQLNPSVTFSRALQAGEFHSPWAASLHRSQLNIAKNTLLFHQNYFLQEQPEILYPPVEETGALQVNRKITG